MEDSGEVLLTVKVLSGSLDSDVTVLFSTQQGSAGV